MILWRFNDKNRILVQGNVQLKYSYVEPRTTEYILIKFTRDIGKKTFTQKAHLTTYVNNTYRTFLPSTVFGN